MATVVEDTIKLNGAAHLVKEVSGVVELNNKTR